MDLKMDVNLERDKGAHYIGDCAERMCCVLRFKRVFVVHSVWT